MKAPQKGAFFILGGLINNNPGYLCHHTKHKTSVTPFPILVSDKLKFL